MPLISVIMPAYNRAAVIPWAIESVLAQTISDWELILVDDASSDSTPDVMRAYASVDSRIRIVHNEVNSRRGPIEWEPRNDGLKIARGSLIAYLDSDNTWRPRFLERLAEVLLAEPELELVYCDSCNHYSAEEARMVIAQDSRNLVEGGATWTVYSNDELDPKKLGFEQYVDTNEMMHRALTFSRLDTLWKTRHPNREQVNSHQSKQCHYRRHNDLDLVQRILEACGAQSIRHLPEVHIDFYYPSAARLPRPDPDPFANAASTPDAYSAIHDQTARFLPDLNVGHFYGDYLGAAGAKGQAATTEVLHDFGLGEIHGIESVDLPELYRSFVAGGGMGDLISRYNGATHLADAYGALAEHYNRAVGASIFNETSIVPFDGCHNALENAVSVLTGTPGWGTGRDLLVYPVPSYPYWAVAAAARRASLAIEAFDAETFIDKLENLSVESIGAVVIHHPGNPLGYSYTRQHFQRLGQLARARDWSLIVDVTYHTFLDSQPPLASLLELPPERTVICDSVSKAWGMPGLRLGFGICYAPDLAAALRANKSGQSLLPSSLKQKFFAHLLAAHPQITNRIVEGVHARKRQARALLCKSPLAALGVELSRDWTAGPFELLFVESLCRRSGQTPESLSAGLREQFGVKVLPDAHFFPPFIKGRDAKSFLRLSLGAIRDVESGVSALIEGLAMHLADEDETVEIVYGI